MPIGGGKELRHTGGPEHFRADHPLQNYGKGRPDRKDTGGLPENIRSTGITDLKSFAGDIRPFADAMKRGREVISAPEMGEIDVF